MAGIPEVNFGRGPSFQLGVEEELLLVDPATHALSHTGSALMAQVTAPDEGRVALDTYEAEIELKSPISASAGEAVGHLRALRAAVRDAGGQAIGSGCTRPRRSATWSTSTRSATRRSCGCCAA
jgi:gamma-glutamyl:cysteine ligase YbdK (ATP-grasp superfamily)